MIHESFKNKRGNINKFFRMMKNTHDKKRVKFSDVIQKEFYDQTPCDDMIDWFLVSVDRMRYKRLILKIYRPILDRINIEKYKRIKIMKGQEQSYISTSFLI
jgi:hypothetical protein